MEVQPLSEAEYAELKTLGLDGVMVYQETYHEAIYARHHLKGKSRISSGDWKRRTGWAARDRQNRSWRVDWFVRQLAG
jgi:2-iminoacetate synthase